MKNIHPCANRICKDVANVMNALYSPLNIYIALVGVVVWTEHDEINLSTDGDTTLKNFLHYSDHISIPSIFAMTNVPIFTCYVTAEKPISTIRKS